MYIINCLSDMHFNDKFYKNQVEKCNVMPTIKGKSGYYKKLGENLVNPKNSKIINFLTIFFTRTMEKV